jgi:uncharacterized protein YbjT (DUF2867 family)
MILVTGATGNIGRELVRELVAKGAPCRALVRDPARAAAALRDGVELAIGDLDDPATLAPAFDGVERVFFLPGGIGLEQTAHVIAAARAADVRQLVHLSSANVLADPLPAMARWHHEREEMVRRSGVPAAFLRPGGFMTNALDWIPSIRDDGYVLDPIGPGRFAPVDPADIAAVAAVVLTGDEQRAEAENVLTGDELLTVREQVAMISAAIGAELEVREAATPEEAVRARFPNGAPPALAAAIVEGFELMRADAYAFRTDTVARLLGRPPRAFADWCARNAQPFREAMAR